MKKKKKNPLTMVSECINVGDYYGYICKLFRSDKGNLIRITVDIGNGFHRSSCELFNSAEWITLFNHHEIHGYDKTDYISCALRCNGCFVPSQKILNNYDKLVEHYINIYDQHCRPMNNFK